MFIIETRSGATYEVDLDTMHIRREGPVFDADADKPDGEWLPIAGCSDPVPGKSMVFMFPDGGCRVTSAVARVVVRASK